MEQMEGMENRAALEQTIARMITGAWVTQALHVAAELGVADELSAAKLTAAELALTLRVREDPLKRVMRALCSIGIFGGDENGGYVLTPLGNLLRTGVPGSKRAMARMAGAEFYFSWSGLAESVRSGDQAFRSCYGKDFFRYMEENPSRWEIYDEAMTAVHDAETLHMIDSYDFAAHKLIVDVGGGNGTALAQVIEASGASGILFDLPSVASRAEEQLSASGFSERINAIGGDFFQAVPEGGDAYILRHVLHDWEDPEAIAILSKCREAAAPGGKILVVENVILPGNDFGFGKWLDLMMLVVGGRERTAAEYERLFAAAGLKLKDLIRTGHEVNILVAAIE